MNDTPTTADDYRDALVRLSAIDEPGTNNLRIWVEANGGIIQALDTLVNYTGERKDVIRWSGALKRTNVDAIRQRCADNGIGIVDPMDVAYPSEAMSRLGLSRPWVLYYKGNVDLLRADRPVAVIGARASTLYGEQVTMSFTNDMVHRGATIISGGAYGVDAAAHRAALGAGGSTIAVMPSGLDRMYPSGNQAMLESVADNGLLVSEMQPATVPTKTRFLARNRIVAALSEVVLVVEAGLRSGSINTAHTAHNLGQMVCAVPGPITSVSSAGCHWLIGERIARLVVNPTEVLSLGGWV